MAELVDALISGVSGETRAGSTPVIRTMKRDAQASFFYIKNFNASVGKGGYLPQSDRDDEDTLKTAAVFNRAEK